MINRVYIDTSVFGGYFDVEFEEPTKYFFKILNEHEVTILVSEILELEIYKAPDHVIQLFESLKKIERVELTIKAKQLAGRYIHQMLLVERVLLTVSILR